MSPFEPIGGSTTAENIEDTNNGRMPSFEDDGSGRTPYTSDEMMTVAASRMLGDGTVCFVGIGLPSAAANLARATHAPNLVLIYESGTIGAKPTRLPLSIGDGSSRRRRT